MLEILRQTALAKVAVWLAAAVLSFSPPAFSACGCSNDSNGCYCCQTSSSEGKSQQHQCCWRRHESPKTAPGCYCCAKKKNKSCCSTAKQTSVKSESGCTCGPNCTCGTPQVPAPAATPPTHDEDPVGPIVTAQLGTLNVCSTVAETQHGTAAPLTGLLVATTSLNRCIDLCRLAL